MQQDYVYPGIYFAYLYFAIMLVGALFFFVRSFKDGYWDERSETAKHQMLKDDERKKDGV
jgi:hypothetical protein